MPVEVRWYCDGLVLYARLNGKITGSDLVDYSTTIQRFMATSDAPLVHLLVDISGVQAYPPLRDIMKSVRMPAQTGWSLVMGVASNVMLNFMTQVVTSALQLRFRKADTLDEALDFLQKVDSTLPDLQQFRGIIANAAVHG